MQLFAVTAPGLEHVAAREISALPGATQIQVIHGGVMLAGDEAVLYGANLRLRSVSRMLLRLGQFVARDFAALRREIAALDWRRYAAYPTRVRVSATAHRSRLYHTGAIEERCLAALADGGIHRPDAPGEFELAVFLRAEQDVFTVSIDTSGELLHRRGWRIEGGEAPLRETLAAGMCLLAGYSKARPMPLRDPTCGSGTLVIEAALLASRRAPGRLRSFAFQRWPSYREAQFRALCRQAEADEQPLEPGLLGGSDICESAVLLARRNAERAGVADFVRFECLDVKKARLPAGPAGLVLCNPPYGKRVDASPLSHRNLRQLYQDVGRYARSAAGWHLGILATHPLLARAAARRTASVPLSNGGLRVALYLSGALANELNCDYPENEERRNEYEF